MRPSLCAHSPHPELVGLGSCSWREETGISEQLFYARHGPRIFHMYGLIQSFPFVFEKGIFTRFIHKELEPQRESNFPKYPANKNHSFLYRCRLSAQPCAKSQTYFYLTKFPQQP